MSQNCSQLRTLKKILKEIQIIIEEHENEIIKAGKDISISVENITPFGVWVFVNEKEYFLSYEDYPYFKEQTLNSVQNVQLLHGYHLYCPIWILTWKLIISNNLKNIH